MNCYLHTVLSGNKIVEVNFYSIRYVLHFPDSGPGYFSGIGIRRKGKWSLYSDVAMEVLGKFSVQYPQNIWAFSSLTRIKTKLRSTMTEERLTNLALLSIERELSA